MKRENNHGEGGHVCPSFLQRKHNRECTLRKRRKKRHRRNQSRRRVWEWKWKCLTLQLLLAVIFVFSVAGLLGYGIFYLCQNESSRNIEEEARVLENSRNGKHTKIGIGIRTNLDAVLYDIHTKQL